MVDSDVLTIPTALIQVSGLSDLTATESRCWWRVIGILSNDKLTAEFVDGAILVRISAKDLMEEYENDRVRLYERLVKLSNISITCNLDGRDGVEIWRSSLKVITEVDMRSDIEYVTIAVGRNFYRAICDRTTYTKIRAAALFSLRSSKYAPRLYALLRDKVAMRVNYWIVTIDDLRTLLQVDNPSYDRFNNFRQHILTKCISEINELTELTVLWDKEETWHNTVKSVKFIWEIKEIDKAKETQKKLEHSSVGWGKVDDRVEAKSEELRRAIRLLECSDYQTRKHWADRFVSLGFGQRFAGMEAIENVGKWFNSAILEVMKKANRD